MAELSKTLQAESLDLTVTSYLAESTLHSLDDAMLPAANWVLDLLDSQPDLAEATVTKVTTADISSFREVTAKFSSAT